jgi:acyl dehydratase
LSGLLHFEDFSPGQRFPLGPYAVTREDIIAFAEEFDQQPFHLDEDVAKASILGGLCASGWHTCAMIMRMLFDGFLGRAASMGSNGIDEVKWLKPVFAGETLAGAMTVLETRRSAKNPSMGVLKFRAAIGNGAETKCEMSGVFFVRVRAP